MKRKTFVSIILGAGMAGSLVALLRSGNPPAAKGALVLVPSPASSTPVLASRPESTASTPVADDPEPRDHPRRQRKRAAQADVECGKVLGLQILAAMESEFPAGLDQVAGWLVEWTQRDPASAGRFAQSLPAGPWREMTLRKIAQGWTVQDAAGAERWATRLPQRERAGFNRGDRVLSGGARRCPAGHGDRRAARVGSGARRRFRKPRPALG